MQFGYTRTKEDTRGGDPKYSVTQLLISMRNPIVTKSKNGEEVQIQDRNPGSKITSKEIYREYPKENYAEHACSFGSK